jgi:hypothetical protein
LDTKGDVCSDSTCNSVKTTGNTYVVGSHFYVRIYFKDNSYTKYLSVSRVTVSDNLGIYEY